MANSLTSKLLFQIPQEQLEKCPLEDSLAAKENGEWKKYSTEKFLEIVRDVSRGLLAKGIEKGENVGLISFNRPEWNFIDLGLQQIGGINVPMFPNIDQQEYKYILEEAEVKTIFVEDERLFKLIDELKDEVKSLENIYTFEHVENARHWSEITEAADPKYDKQIEKTKGEIKEDDLATIVYTSGTTGDPKGVMLTHKNIVSNVKAVLPLLPVGEGSRALSFLPLNHIFERMHTYLYMAAGISIYYAESVDKVGDNLKEVKPHIFTTVPRLLEKVYKKIVTKGKEQNRFTRSIFMFSLRLAKRYELSGKGRFYRAMLNFAKRVVFSKWRAALGGNVKLIVAGGAALNPELARIFTAAGLPVLEGYGLTETSPVIAVNRWEKENRRFGTVGKPIEDVEVKIAEDGEVLCKGPNVMQGYYKKQEKTDEVLEEDGWFHTKDVGSIDEEGFLTISDRKDSVFKTSGGKKVVPQPIENKLKESPFIEQAVLIGKGKKMVTALISPDFERLKKWCKEKNISCDSNEDMVKKKEVMDHFQQIIDEKNQGFGHTEQVKEFRLVPDEWSVENGELTPTQKVKRPVVKEKYEEQINEMYQE